VKRTEHKGDSTAHRSLRGAARQGRGAGAHGTITAPANASSHPPMLDTPVRPIDAPDTETMEKRGRRIVPQEDPSDPVSPRRFGGIARLYGAAGMTRIAAGRVCVVGVGGVGSWAAEALARSGVGAITLIDMDHVAESNINRQVVADSTTLGMAKIEVMARRI